MLWGYGKVSEVNGESNGVGTGGECHDCAEQKDALEDESEELDSTVLGRESEDSGLCLEGEPVTSDRTGGAASERLHGLSALGCSISSGCKGNVCDVRKVAMLVSSVKSL